MTKLPYIKKGYSANMRFADEHEYSPHLTFFLFLLVIGISFFFLFVRLFQLTVVKGSYYRRLAESNRIREIIIEPRRGMILDRKGVTLVQNDAPNLTSLEARLPSKRVYQSPQEALAPVIGYRQIANEEDLANDPCINKLTLGDKVGKKGIEKLYDCQLRGMYGKKMVEVDAHGEILRTINVQPAKDGETLKLAIDWELQKKAYELIKDKRGAVVALKPDTGEILAMVSSPTYDPQAFEDGLTDQTTAYIKDENKPLFNRATEGVYPPGSVFKLAVALGALEEKKITEKTVIEDTGTLKAGSLSFGNWYYLQYGKTDGEVNITKAIRRSNDIFFYKTGDLLGPDNIKKWAERLGFGQKTGVGLEEAEGTVPSPFWKREVLNEGWYTGDTYNFSIGQGYTLVTPLQVALSTQTIANEGRLCKPQLLKDVEPECKQLPVSAHTLLFVREGMLEACAPGGTGWPLFDFKIRPASAGPAPTTSPESSTSADLRGATIPIQVACKTGTAESNSEEDIPHAWFTAYAPYKDPEIVLSVLIEESGQGSDIAGPIVRDILTSYFERDE